MLLTLSFERIFEFLFSVTCQIYCIPFLLIIASLANVCVCVISISKTWERNFWPLICKLCYLYLIDLLLNTSISSKYVVQYTAYSSVANLSTFNTRIKRECCHYPDVWAWGGWGLGGVNWYHQRIHVCIKSSLANFAVNITIHLIFFFLLILACLICIKDFLWRIFYFLYYQVDILYHC